MRGTFLPPALGRDPPAFVVAVQVAAALTPVCGATVQPEVDRVELPGLAYPAAATLAAAIHAEQVTPAWLTPAGRVAVAVGAGYDGAAQRQIVLAVAKVWHGLGEVHTSAIRALEAQAACPLPPPVAAWPWDLAQPVLTWFAAVRAWTDAGRPHTAGLTARLLRLSMIMGGASARCGTPDRAAQPEGDAEDG